MSEKYDITLNEGLKGATVRKDKKAPGQSSPWYYLGVAGQIGYVIATPLVGGVLIGFFADSQLGTSPKFTLIGLGVGSLVSGLGFVRTVKKLLEP